MAYYHSAICIAYQEEDRSASCIIYTPHGISWDSLATLDTNGITTVKAVLHGLHEVTNPKVRFMLDLAFLVSSKLHHERSFSEES